MRSKIKDKAPKLWLEEKKVLAGFPGPVFFILTSLQRLLGFKIHSIIKLKMRSQDNFYIFAISRDILMTYKYVCKVEMILEQR